MLFLPGWGFGFGDPCALGAGALLLLRLSRGIRTQQTLAFCAWSGLALPQHWLRALLAPGYVQWTHGHLTFNHFWDMTDNYIHVEIATAGNVRQLGCFYEASLLNPFITCARIFHHRFAADTSGAGSRLFRLRAVRGQILQVCTEVATSTEAKFCYGYFCWGRHSYMRY